jgi:hypothetical protein
MSGMRENTSKDLGRRSFGTMGGRKTRDDMSEQLGIVILFPVSREWKPRLGSIHNFPVRRVVEEK